MEKLRKVGAYVAAALILVVLGLILREALEGTSFVTGIPVLYIVGAFLAWAIVSEINARRQIRDMEHRELQRGIARLERRMGISAFDPFPGDKEERDEEEDNEWRE